MPTREAVACDLCGQDDAAPLLTKQSYRVVRCRHCDLVYVNPRLRSDALSALYDVDSFQHNQEVRGDDTAHDTGWRHMAEERLALVDRYAGHAAGRALLDVGCSNGGFMGVAREGGWEVTGLDVSARSVEAGRKKGLDIRLATLDTTDLASGRFHAITLFDSIEHMPSPMAALRVVHRLLADGGVVMLTTPNIDGLFPRLTWQLFGRTLGAWEHPGPPGHVYQFSKKTLATALERNGFEVVHMATEAIALDHTVGELEDALMGVLKGETRRPRPADAEIGLHDEAAAGAAASAAKRKQAPAVSPATRVARLAVRRVVRTGAWILTNAVAGPAPLFGEGDSLIALARKRA